MSVLVVVCRVPAISVLVLSQLVGAPASAAPATDSCLWRKSVLDVYHASVGPAWRVGRAMRIWNDVHEGQPRLRTVTSRAAADVVVSPYRASDTLTVCGGAEGAARADLSRDTNGRPHVRRGIVRAKRQHVRQP